MRLFINDTELHFSLEQEKNVADVYASLTLLLDKENAIITDITVNQHSIDLNNISKDNTPIADIETLRVLAISRTEMLLRSRTIIFEFLGQLLTALKSDTLPPQNLEVEYKKVHTTIDSFFFKDSTHVVLSSLFELIWNSGGFANRHASPSQLHIDVSITLLTDLRSFIQNYSEEHTTETMRLLLQSFIRSFRILPQLLHAQYYKEVLQLIFTFSEAFKVYVHYAEKSMHPDTLTLITNTTNYLSTLHDAIEAKDWITIGDICEYELLPLLTSI